MEMQSLTITRAQYGANAGQFQASITMKGGKTYPADITMPLPDELLAPIVAIVEQAIVATMTRSAAEFTAAMQEQLEASGREQRVIEGEVNATAIKPE